MRDYTERYDYDKVGNFLNVIHRAQNGNWVRDYTYQEPSLIQPGSVNNRLGGTVVHPDANQPIAETYTHDAHGNMTAMPHLQRMEWNFNDQFQSANLGGGGTSFYAYDAAGQRVRKVIERQNGMRQKDRIYLGGFEVYREYDSAGTGITLERETLHIMDDRQRIVPAQTRTKGSDGRPGNSLVISMEYLARPAWSWTRSVRSFSHEGTTRMACRIRWSEVYRRSAARTGIPAKSEMRTKFTITALDITSPGFAGGRVAIPRAANQTNSMPDARAADARRPDRIPTDERLSPM